ncbi:MAG: universal stress protein [Deltaproteobacteria bacterium]|nr:universal stress protein [Deltaproteobacteria bacterium]
MGREYKKVLICVDGSDSALETIQYVSNMLPPEMVDIVLFHVRTPIPEDLWDLEKGSEFHSQLAPVAAWAMQQESEIRSFMSKAKHILTEAHFPEEKIIPTIRDKRAGVARDLIQESQEGYHAVVVGRRGFSRLKELILGSVATKLIERASNVPIWVVGKTPKTGKILLAVDGSGEAVRASDYVGALMGGADVEITLFHAIKGIGMTEKKYKEHSITQIDEEWMKKAGTATDPVFHDVRNRLVAAGLNPNKITTKVMTGVSSRAGAIVGEAEEGGYGTIVMGRRGKHKVQEFSMGRVTNKVIQLAREMAVWVIN